jgi:ArsR family metal-binding transcriptional regulator
MAVVTTFPRTDQFEKAKACLDARGLPYRVISPSPVYARVGAPGLVVEEEVKATLSRDDEQSFVCSGWVDFRPSGVLVTGEPAKSYAEDVFGSCAVMVLAPCVADTTKIRLIAHLSKDIAPVFPYLNTAMPQCSFNPHSSIVTFMESYRMISLYAWRLTVAKADDLVDAWRVLEKIRCLVNDTWARRASIVPSDELRRRPPALEIFKRLPGTNCRQCGEQSCMAFAVGVWNGELLPSLCTPTFDGAHRHLKDPLLQICAGLGFAPDQL